MKKFITAALLGAASLGLAACDVDQTEEGSLPEVEGGNMPEFDVEPADVDVDSNIEMPEVDVDVDQPDADGEPVTGDE
ncbi:hypothetical protein [Erythrobacter ani]|uniref:Secreted protein n=1 Tax=Erythrobacter ani TaxID=2827235 RepID=A0ABS6SKI2_9SPHN|nr:hypothetical protein [Erythrobacter ani]MBV7265518.1 hypothetical protein [Erythrobacter ani]